MIPYGQGPPWSPGGQEMQNPLYPANPSRRFFANLIDHASATLLAYGFLICALADPATWGRDPLPAAWLLIFVVFVLNTVVLQGWTGLSLGRVLTHTRAIETRDGDPPGIPRMALRYVLFVGLEVLTLGTIVLINCVWVVGQRRQTVPDFWCGVAIIRDR